MTDPKSVVDLIIDSDERVGEGGFLAIRRVRLRNRRADGSASSPYLSDSIARPYGQDAVVVAIHAGDQVLVRDCLRPTQRLGRDADRAPLPELPPGLFVTELVAGIIEEHDRDEAGLRARGAHEVFEEAGFVVGPEQLVLLGAGLYPSPGAMVEKCYFVAVAVDPSTQQALGGDGSPMEEGAVTRWLPLDDAIAACVRGEICDLKTELGLRRLRDHLRDPKTPGRQGGSTQPIVDQTSLASSPARRESRPAIARVAGRFAVARLAADAPIPSWAEAAFGVASSLSSLTRTAHELSIVCDEASVPDDVRAERNFAVFRVAGTVDFSVVGLLATLTRVLADGGVAVFALSTFDTDYLLVRTSDLARAGAVLASVAVLVDDHP